MTMTANEQLEELETKWNNNTITPDERQKLIAWSEVIR